MGCVTYAGFEAGNWTEPALWPVLNTMFMPQDTQLDWACPVASVEPCVYATRYPVGLSLPCGLCWTLCLCHKIPSGTEPAVWLMLNPVFVPQDTQLLRCVVFFRLPPVVDVLQVKNQTVSLRTSLEIIVLKNIQNVEITNMLLAVIRNSFPNE
jgi:hypothetical protein